MTTPTQAEFKALEKAFKTLKFRMFEIEVRVEVLTTVYFPNKSSYFILICWWILLFVTKLSIRLIAKFAFNCYFY